MTDPLKLFSEWFIFNFLNIAKDSQLGIATEFFLYDSIKIITLLFVMIFIVGIIRTYFSPKMMKNFLSIKIPGLSNLLASIFGAITPFCSCSSIPIFIGFIESGLSPGVAFSFLATSPLVNEYVAVLMFGFFGWEITTIYVFLGISLGTIIGILMSMFQAEKYLEPDIDINKKQRNEIQYKSMNERMLFGYNEAKSIVTKLWLWVLMGVAMGAIIHGFIPDDFIDFVLQTSGIFSVPLAVLVGIPIYANCGAVIPIAVALFEKGVPLGTALAFMMATAALSLPEAIILRRVMKLKLLALFFAIVVIGIMIIGYILNLL